MVLDIVEAYDWDPTSYTPITGRQVGSDSVSIAIARLWKKKRQQSRTYANKLKMKEFLETDLFSDYKLSITGSSANGYGFNDSDVDMCLQVGEPTTQTPNLTLMMTRVCISDLRNLFQLRNSFSPLVCDPCKILRNLRTQMAGNKVYKRPIVIAAICPLLTFTYERSRHSPMSVEINVNSQVGIVNTQFLYAYSRMDGRVAPLVGACKRWATIMGIKDAHKSTLSSYSLTLMVINYLQQQEVVPVLHNLVPEFESGLGFKGGDRLILPRYASTNSQNLGTLFKGFLAYFSAFDFENICISVREGRTLTKQEGIDQDPDIPHNNHSSRADWKFINIQEPFNLTNTARAVYQPKAFRKVRDVFKISHQTINQRGGIEHLLGLSESDMIGWKRTDGRESEKPS
ncbi:poly(A) RNA polymerase GLD2 [Galendromus occidentalis]|uniref:Poly(A) RNA polymerase GLD2 n=1 Tax=Galendromus occidentalis TaxID=34638 RepID=A0AAJ7WI52_9ACAR|nr:poly(A) RNA polymerase GLD2 [Galendromus occidentalis]